MISNGARQRSEVWEYMLFVESGGAKEWTIFEYHDMRYNPYKIGNVFLMKIAQKWLTIKMLMKDHIASSPPKVGLGLDYNYTIVALASYLVDCSGLRIL